MKNTPTITSFRLVFRLLATMTLVLLVSATSNVLTSQEQTASLEEVRKIEAGATGWTGGFALAYSPATNTFLTLPAGQEARAVPATAGMALLTFHGESAGLVVAPVTAGDATNIAFGSSGNLLLLRDDADTLVEVRAREDGSIAEGEVVTVDASRFGVRDAQGMTVDPASDRLFILDAAAHAIVQVAPDARQGRGAVALEHGRVRHIRLGDDIPRALRGIAFNPADGHLYVMARNGGTLYRVDDMGRPAVVFDLAGAGLAQPQSIFFAPSGDLTDEPWRTSLYVADGGTDGRAAIVELAFTMPMIQPSATGSTEAVLVSSFHTSTYTPPSPDPVGVAYLPRTGTLLISDSEVSEMPQYFTGDNLFHASLSGALVRTTTTIPFSDEPTGLALNPQNGHLFVTDDTGIRSVYEVDPGADRLYGTADDSVTSFPTAAFGSLDPEGIAYARDGSGDLFIADGVNREIYRVSSGPNGVFDGVPPGGDDVVSQFDTLGFGLVDPEGIAFNPYNGHLYAVGKPLNLLFEFTQEGALVQTIDISAANPYRPNGITFAPGSQDPTLLNVYIADRGVDNDADPNENDGRVYELSLGIRAASNMYIPFISIGADDSGPIIQSNTTD